MFFSSTSLVTIRVARSWIIDSIIYHYQNSYPLQWDFVVSHTGGWLYTSTLTVGSVMWLYLANRLATGLHTRACPPAPLPFVKITHLVRHAAPRKMRNTEAYLDSTTPHPWGPPWPRKPILCPPIHKKDRINCCWFKSLNFGTVYYATVVDQYRYPVLWLWGEKWSEVKWLSRVWLFATPWTVACQAALSMGFSRQEYCSGLPFPLPGDLPNPGIEPRSPSLQADALP